METLLGLIWSLNFECLHKGHFRQINLAIRVLLYFQAVAMSKQFTWPISFEPPYTF